MTRWGSNVTPENVWPEYPRPQLTRPEWSNLNGLWDYAITSDSADQPTNFAGQILVPFPVESALSGVATNFDEQSRLWYHRSFTVPASWRGQRVRLHFGAVDWHCDVRVNDWKVGLHEGGYDAFSFDITDALRWQGAEQMVVGVTDPTEGDQPRGKQSRKPDGIFYTPTSGIWQTVWLEPVPAVCIDRLKCVPDVDTNSVHLWVAVNSLAPNLRVEAVASSNGIVVATISGVANDGLVLNLSHPHLWSPDDPFLYDLKVTLKDGGKILDTVGSYFGMRKIALRKDDQGFNRITLNDRSYFGIGTLDQGFWPEGIYTAPSDEALRADIEFLKKAGFNFTRKHVKVEPERWYYWCDKLGLLVWQDMPSGNNATPAGRRQFENELHRMISGLENHPAIVVWVLFNEGWGQYDTKPLTDWLKSLDPSRLVDDASGWTDMRTGDLLDMHSYPGPAAPMTEARCATVLGEFGGLGLAVEGHTWSSKFWGYLMVPDASELSLRYAQMLKQVWKLHYLRGLSAVVYTQTADVETECNGLLTYDRAVAKISPDILWAANRLTLPDMPKDIILADALFGRVGWSYTMEKPAEDWYEVKFDASAWKTGPGGFGSPGTPGVVINTTWNSSDIWLRRSFTVGSEELAQLKLQLFHDEDVEVYMNGQLALEQPGFVQDYDEYDIAPAALAALHQGENTIAVHCHQTTGGQGVDVGIIVPQPAEAGSAKK
jgi:hypothetical protein